MRWIWIDAFIKFESGVKATAVKSVTLAEDYLHSHFPGYPVYPPVLLIEGMAQTAGILVGEARGFRERVILAKIRHAEFTDVVVPGEQVQFDATLQSIDERAGVTTGVLRKGEREFGRVDLIFSHLDQAERNLDLPNHNFVFTDQFMSLLAPFRDGASRGDSHTDDR
jgi:3-hydroxyacyl-[acyl-carrier-protein] dehydratase